MIMTQSWIRPEVRTAFVAASHVVFNRSLVSAPSARNASALYVQFARRYQSMCALPRSTRRALERAWKKPLAAIALLLTLGQGTALAATITVDAATPPPIQADGKCSLVEAIINANDDTATHADCAAGSSADTLVLPSRSRHQTSASYGPNHDRGLPLIESPIVIEGRGSEIVGSDGVRAVLDIAASGTLTINDTTVSGDSPASRITSQGGIFNRGTLTLNRSTITRCGEYGVGLANAGGTVTLNDSVISNNNSHGIENSGGGTVTLVHSAVKDNHVYWGSGGINNEANSTLILRNSTVQANRASYGNGGGIINVGILTISHSTIVDNSAYAHGGSTGGGILNRTSGVATISHSTIAGNRASGDYGGSGGGIDNRGTLTISNSTITGNAAGGNYGSSGGGISNGGTLTISNSTITGNIASGGWDRDYGIGGGIINWDQVTLSRTIVSGNTALYLGAEILNYASVIADDYNLIGHSGNAGSVGFTPGARDIVPSQALSGILLPLAHNAGKTKTHALAIHSPALDASPADAGCPVKDQRGASRPRGKGCDIGAFEGSAAMCGGVVTTQVGTPGNDVIYGTPGPDVIAGLGAQDIIKGLQGDDLICGGKGNDRLVGGPGIDTLLGEAGDDVLLGQGNDDVLNGGIGTDQCDGGKNDAAGDFAAQCETVIGVP